MTYKTLLLTPALLLAAASSTLALTFDDSVNLNGPAPVNSNDQGIYYGNGNGNGGWTVDRQNNIELGLRAHVRYPSPQNVFNSSGNGVYSFNDQNGYGPVGQNRSSWNYDFSINANHNNAGLGTLASYVFSLGIDSDPGAGQNWNFINPLSIPDNAPLGSLTIAQNSENARFPIVGIPGYDNTIPGTYDFVLSAYDLSGDLAARTFIRVNINGGTASGPLTSVPDGGTTAMLLGAAVTGLGMLRRKLA